MMRSRREGKSFRLHRARMGMGERQRRRRYRLLSFRIVTTRRRGRRSQSYPSGLQSSKSDRVDRVGITNRYSTGLPYLNSILTRVPIHPHLPSPAPDDLRPLPLLHHLFSIPTPPVLPLLPLLDALHLRLVSLSRHPLSNSPDPSLTKRKEMIFSNWVISANRSRTIPLLSKPYPRDIWGGSHYSIIELAQN